MQASTSPPEGTQRRPRAIPPGTHRFISNLGFNDSLDQKAIITGVKESMGIGDVVNSEVPNADLKIVALSMGQKEAIYAVEHIVWEAQRKLYRTHETIAEARPWAEVNAKVAQNLYRIQIEAVSPFRASFIETGVFSTDSWR